MAAIGPGRPEFRSARVRVCVYVYACSVCVHTSSTDRAYDEPSRTRTRTRTHSINYDVCPRRGHRVVCASWVHEERNVSVAPPTVPVFPYGKISYPHRFNRVGFDRHNIDLVWSLFFFSLRNIPKSTSIVALIWPKTTKDFCVTRASVFVVRRENGTVRIVYWTV